MKGREAEIIASADVLFVASYGPRLWLISMTCASASVSGVCTLQLPESCGKCCPERFAGDCILRCSVHHCRELLDNNQLTMQCPCGSCLLG